MLDPHTVIWSVGQAPYLCVIYVLYHTGTVLDLDITKSQYTDVVFWHLHVEKAVCMNITWHKKIHRCILTRKAASYTVWLQQNFSWYWTRPQTVPSVTHKYMAAILKVLEAKGRQIISSAWGLHTWTHALIAPYYWSWRQQQQKVKHTIIHQLHSFLWKLIQWKLIAHFLLWSQAVPAVRKVSPYTQKSLPTTHNSSGQLLYSCNILGH
jgi:hypothetical protein